MVSRLHLTLLPRQGLHLLFGAAPSLTEGGPLHGSHTRSEGGEGARVAPPFASTGEKGGRSPAVRLPLHLSVQPPAPTCTKTTFIFISLTSSLLTCDLPVRGSGGGGGALLDCEQGFTGNEMKSDTPL